MLNAFLSATDGWPARPDIMRDDGMATKLPPDTVIRFVYALNDPMIRTGVDDWLLLPRKDRIRIVSSAKLRRIGRPMDDKFAAAQAAITSDNAEELERLVRGDPSLAMDRSLSPSDHPTLLCCLVLEMPARKSLERLIRLFVQLGAELNGPLVAAACIDNKIQNTPDGWAEYAQHLHSLIIYGASGNGASGESFRRANKFPLEESTTCKNGTRFRPLLFSSCSSLSQLVGPTSCRPLITSGRRSITRHRNLGSPVGSVPGQCRIAA